MSARTALLAPTFTCPGCARRLRSPVVPPPAWLRCVHCRTRFIGNLSKVKNIYWTFVLAGISLLGAAIGFWLWGGSVIYVPIGFIAFGAACLLRGIIGLVVVRHRQVGVVGVGGGGTAGAQQAATQPRQVHPAFVAASNNNLPGVQDAINSGFPVNSISPEGISCLQYAAQGGHVAIVDYLLARGADPNVRSTGSCPFLEAAACGHLEVLKLLVQAGAQEFVTTTPRRGQVQVNALTLACVRGHPHVAEFLLSRGHDPNFSTPGCHPPLLCAAKEGFVEIIETLCTYGADPNRQNSQQMTALHVAVTHNRPGVVRALLERGASKQILDRNGLTPVELARRRNRVELVQLFEMVQPVDFSLPPPSYEETIATSPATAAAAVPPPTATTSLPQSPTQTLQEVVVRDQDGPFPPGASNA